MSVIQSAAAGDKPLSSFCLHQIAEAMREGSRDARGASPPERARALLEALARRGLVVAQVKT